MAYNHYQYGLSIAKGLREIAHSDTNKRYFFATEDEGSLEMIEGMSSSRGMIMVSIDGTNSDFDWQCDNLTEKPQYFFLVLESGDSTQDDILARRMHCKRIAMQIIAKMMADYASGDSTMQQLLPDTLIMRGIGPVVDNYHGVLIGFNISLSTNYAIDETAWL